MHQPLIPLVAAGLDWLEGLLPLVFVVIWIASQVLNLFRGARPQQGRPQRQPPRPPVAAGGPPRPPSDLEQEIEEFLRGRIGRGEPVTSGPADPGAAKATRRRPRKKNAVEPPALTGNERSVAGAAASPGGDIVRHVATAFAHDLVHESPDAIAASSMRPAPPSPTAELIAALRTPAGLRQFLLMKEVLERPTHRW